jgi:hypothetical protein
MATRYRAKAPRNSGTNLGGRSYSGVRNHLETRTNSSGYKQFKDPATGHWELTHRRVAEKLVGGKIYAGREVHHIDGNKTNNRPSNLAVLSKTDHREIHKNK